MEELMDTITVTEKRDDGIVLFEMKNENLTVKVTNLGCHILSILMKDKNGQEDDVVLGLEEVDDYYRDDKYLGALVGRVANRIGHGSFCLNGKRYELAINSGVNHLHGGQIGFDKKLFDYEIKEDRIIFTYVSPHMEEGYPGTLTLKAEYCLEGDVLTIRYHAVSDQDTICNFTNHSYFNLTGGKTDILTHKLLIEADQILCIDHTGLATGETMDVEGTAFDFRSYHSIGERIGADEEQLKLGGGYDHTFLLNKAENQMELYHEETGRKLSISTTLPGVQLYTANFLSGGLPGKHGENKNRYAVCLETQMMPNSINIETEPGVILRKGESFESSTSYKFEIVK